MTARKNFFKLSLNNTTEKFFIKYGTPGRKRKIMQIKKGLFEINGFLYLNFEIKLFALVAIKKFNKELITRVNNEINAPKYPKAKADINSTGVTIPIKEIQIMEITM